MCRLNIISSVCFRYENTPALKSIHTHYLTYSNVSFRMGSNFSFGVYEHNNIKERTHTLTPSHARRRIFPNGFQLLPRKSA